MKLMWILIGCMTCIFVLVICLAKYSDSNESIQKEIAAEQKETAKQIAAEHHTDQHTEDKEQDEEREKSYKERIEAEHKDQAEASGDDKRKRRQALGLAFAEVMRQQGYEVSVNATDGGELDFDCSTALEPRSTCYAAYQSSKHLPKDVKAELRAVGITTFNFSPNGEMIPTWATNIN